MAILEIVVYPDPVLRKKCQPVQSFDESLKKIAEDMTDTVHAAPGVGLAAPQVGLDIRLAVVDLSTGEDPSALYYLVNPEISAPQGEESEVEGCLSIPYYKDRVKRPKAITLNAFTLEGLPFSLEANGWLARAIQHEVDHLNGVLFVDYLSGLRKDRARRFLKKLRRHNGE